MQPDVICPAEHLPFADGAFDLVVSRIAAHHFEDVAAAVAEMARVARDRVLVVDTLYESEAVEEAERLRDPSHVRSYTEARVARPSSRPRGSGSRTSSVLEKRDPLDGWLARAGTSEADAARVRELLADQIEGDEYVDRKILLKRRKGGLSGDHRRPRHEARRPGPDRHRGLVPRAPQQALRHAGRRGRHPGQGRPGRRGHPGLRHGRRGGRRDGREHDDGLRPGALRRRRDLRGGRRGHRHRDLHRRGPAGARDAARLHLHPAEGRDDDRPELPGRALAREGERRDHPGRDLPRGDRSGSSRARAR